MSKKQFELLKRLEAIKETKVDYQDRPWEIERLKKLIDNGQIDEALTRAKMIITQQVNIHTLHKSIKNIVVDL